MKKIIATALLSLVALGFGAHQAYAFGFGCCHYNYRCCAAQYNAFSPFCCNTVMTKKHFCKKCFHVLDCGQPCPPPCYPVDPCWGGGHMPGGAVMDAGHPPATGGQQFQAPAPAPAGPNTSMLGMPYGMPYNGMIHMTGYQPYAQPYGYPQQPMMNYGYPQQQLMQQQMIQQQMMQQPVMLPGYGAMTTNGVVPMNSVPWYGNGSVPVQGQ
jgi:hypothetical protein